MSGDGALLSVRFVSRRIAETLAGRRDTELVSITDQEPAVLGADWGGVLRLAFYDVEPAWAGPGQRLMSEEQADEIARFAHIAAAKHKHLLVHCHSGISRSGAVAFALCERWKLPFDGELKECNAHVLHLMRSALARQSPSADCTA